MSGSNHCFKYLAAFCRGKRPAFAHQAIAEEARQAERPKSGDIASDTVEVEGLIGEERCRHCRPDCLQPVLLLVVPVCFGHLTRPSSFALVRSINGSFSGWRA